MRFYLFGGAALTTNFMIANFEVELKYFSLQFQLTDQQDVCLSESLRRGVTKSHYVLVPGVDLGALQTDTKVCTDNFNLQHQRAESVLINLLRMCASC